MDNLLEKMKNTPLVKQLNHLKELGYNCEAREYSDFMRLFTYLDSDIVIQKYSKSGEYINMYIVKRKTNETIHKSS